MFAGCRILLGLALITPALAAGDPPPAVLTVPGDSDTIQGAIDMATGPTIIKVKKDHYHEAVVFSVKSGITLLGKGKPVIDPQTADPAITIADSSDIVIQGFKLENALSGVEITGSTDVTVAKCEILAMTDDGVHALDSSFLVIEKNKVHDCGRFGLDIGDVPGASDCLVSKNKVEDTGAHGILLGGSNNTAEKNKVTRAGGHGLEVRSVVVSSGNTFRKNLVKQAGATGLLSNGTGNVIEKNKVITSAEEGLLVDETSSGNTITGNTLVKAGTQGLHVAGDENTVSGCKVVKAGEHGVLVAGDTNDFDGNKATKSASDGFHVIGTGNEFTKNKASNSGDFDLEDENAPGANTYTDNVFKENNLGL